MSKVSRTLGGGHEDRRQAVQDGDPAIRELFANREHPGFGSAVLEVQKLQGWGVEVDAELVRKILDDAPRPAERQARLNQGHESLVYFIRFGDRIKIGVTTNLHLRLMAIPHDEVVATIPGDRQLEKRLHAKFRHLRIKGEWFSAGGDLLDYINGATKVAS